MKRYWLTRWEMELDPLASAYYCVDSTRHMTRRSAMRAFRRLRVQYPSSIFGLTDLRTGASVPMEVRP